MTNSVAGAPLSVAAPGNETVTVTSVTATYLVATFVSTHLVGAVLTGGGHLLAGVATTFAFPCATAANYVFRASVPFIATPATRMTACFQRGESMKLPRPC